jgi:Zn-dependent protease with chaperone function
LNETRAARYQRFRRRARAAGLACAVGTLALVALTPAGHWLAAASASLAAALAPSLAAPFALVLFLLVLVALWEAATLPAALFLALRIERAYGTRAATAEDVLGAQTQAAALVLPGALLAAAIVQVSAAIAGQWWWLPAAVALALVMAAALRLAPDVAVRVAALRPLNRPELVQKLDALAARARVQVTEISEWVVAETEKTAALVTGVGRHRRVLLTSDIARRWSDEEVMVVVAHELAHHVYHDLWRALGLHVVVLSAALWIADAAVRITGPWLNLAGPSDLAALPLMSLVTLVVWLASAPVRFGQSRRHERRADVFALAMTNGAEAFGAAIRRLGARHLAEERPSRLTRWFSHRHPSVAERLALADAFRRLRP